MYMADRVLRGSRMGAVSYETDRDHDLAPRQMVRYKTETNEVFEVPFAHDAEIPGEWLCKNGQVGILMEGEGIEAKPSKPARTHWDMLRERRSIEDLDILLEERIEQLRKRRRNAARLLKQQQQEEAAGDGVGAGDAPAGGEGDSELAEEAHDIEKVHHL